MTRAITRPSTAQCNISIYTGFILSEPEKVSCRHLGEIMDISHDCVNRFLNRESYDGQDLLNDVKTLINLEGGILSADDTVLDKPYAQYIGFIGHFWSGKHHACVLGINLISLYYTDLTGKNVPVNFRIYDKSENKTKNDYLLEMLDEVLAWGLKPSMITTDSWYSCTNNLKIMKKHGLGLMVAVKSNRIVSIEKGTWQQVQAIDIPDEGLIVWLKDFGNVKLFRKWLKDEPRHYIVYVSDEEKLLEFSMLDFTKIHDVHWQIEQYHRTIKQVCNIENFQVRGKQAVKNHIFAAIYGYTYLQRLKFADVIHNCYQLRKDLFKNIIFSFISDFVIGKDSLHPQFNPVVNA